VEVASSLRALCEVRRIVAITDGRPSSIPLEGFPSSGTAARSSLGGWQVSHPNEPFDYMRRKAPIGKLNQFTHLQSTLR
jgi:hypothetical protein